MKKLCCSMFNTIYLANVNDEGRMVGERIELTRNAIEAVMEYMAGKASEKVPFDGKYEVDVHGFKLILDATGCERFMKKYSATKEAAENANQ